jgi:hypothetical protein
MTVLDLLVTLATRGVRLHVDGDRLIYRAPEGTMTPELLWDLEAHKAEIISVLPYRRRCRSCGSAGRCEGRVPLPGGGWSCQAAINAGLLPNPADEPAEDLRRHERWTHSGEPGRWWQRQDGEMVCGICHPPVEGAVQGDAHSEAASEPEAAA